MLNNDLSINPANMRNILFYKEINGYWFYYQINRAESINN